MPRYDLPNAAPEPLRLVQLFVNTADHEHGREWLGRPEDLACWLRERQLPAPRIGARELQRALELREALRTLLWANNGGPVEADAIAAVSASHVCLRLDEHGDLVFDTGTAVDRVVATAFEAMLDGSWRRLKACRQCGFAFYDRSRNRSATWCSMAICGNRLKTKAYRRRKGAR